VAVGFGVQHVQVAGDRVVIVDDNRITLFDLQGVQVGATVTTSGDPEVSTLCWLGGSYLTFGTGCGTAQQFAFGDPSIGGTSTYQVFGPASAPAVLNIGFSRTNWLGVPLPLDLGIIGAPGCSLYTGATIGLPLLTSTEGFADLDISVAPFREIVGLVFVTQFFVAAPGANSLGVVTSDAVVTSIGEGAF
jgi:hypothetical protein